MRNELIGIVTALGFVAAAATVGCDTGSDTPAASAGAATNTAAGTTSGSTAGGTANTAGTAVGGAAGNAGAATTGGNAGAGVAGAAVAGSSGSGSGGAAAGSVTSLGEAKTLGSLTAAEGTQLCNDTYAYFGTATPKAVACKWVGLAYAASSSSPDDQKLKQNCSSHETSCQDTVPWATNSGCSGLPATCMATVGAYSTCIKAEIAAFTQKVGTLPGCDTVTLQTTSGVSDTMTAALPSECDAVSNMCPELTLPNPTY